MCNYSRVDFDFRMAAASAGNRLSFFATRVIRSGRQGTYESALQMKAIVICMRLFCHKSF